MDDPNVGLSFHDYCLGAAPGLPRIPDAGLCESEGEPRPLRNAEQHSRETGAALLLTEFGDTEDPAIHERVATLADEFMVGWTNWAYMGSTGQIKRVNELPPTPANLRAERLAAVVRAYAPAVAGTPERHRYDPATRVFELRFSTRLPGGRPAGALETEIFVPRLHYGDDYRVELAGAELVAGLGTQTLVLRACPGAARVSVRVADEPGVAPDGCGN